MEAINRKFLIATGATLATLGAIGCSDSYSLDPAKPSRVVQTTFTPAHDEKVDGICLVKSEGICILHAKNTVHRDDEWSIKIEQCEDGILRSEPADGCVTDEIDVSHTDFDRVRTDSVVTYDANNHNQLHVVPR